MATVQHTGALLIARYGCIKKVIKKNKKAPVKNNKPIPIDGVDVLFADDGAVHHEQISKIIDEHIHWITRVAHTALTTADSKKELPKPRTFASWYRTAAQSLPCEQTLIDRLAVLHDQLHKTTAHVIAKAGDKPVDETTYNHICSCFKNFIEPLRTFEKSFIATVNGRDQETDLRSRYSVLADLVAEQKRMARSGMPLTLVLCRIDKFKEIETLYGADTTSKVIATAAECLLGNLRAYDCAFRINNNLFLLCLKRTNETDADVVLTRLQQAISTANVRLFGGGSLVFTMSFVKGALTPQSDISTLLRDIEKNLTTV